MSGEDKAILLGQVLGKVDLLVGNVAALDTKASLRAKEMYIEIAKIKEEVGKLKAKVYWMAVILTILLNAIGKGADLLGLSATVANQDEGQGCG